MQKRMIKAKNKLVVQFRLQLVPLKYKPKLINISFCITDQAHDLFGLEIFSTIIKNSRDL